MTRRGEKCIAWNWTKTFGPKIGRERVAKTGGKKTFAFSSQIPVPSGCHSSSGEILERVGRVGGLGRFFDSGQPYWSRSPNEVVNVGGDVFTTKHKIWPFSTSHKKCKLFGARQILLLTSKNNVLVEKVGECWSSTGSEERLHCTSLITSCSIGLQHYVLST